MKKVIWMACAILLMIVNGCQRKAQTQKTAVNIQAVELTRTACRGKCPSYKIRISSTQDVLFEGYQHIVPIGTFNGKITSAQWKELEDELKAADYSQLPENSISGATDVSISYWVISDDENSYPISYDREGQPDLRKIEKMIESWVSQMSWEG